MPHSRRIFWPIKYRHFSMLYVCVAYEIDLQSAANMLRCCAIASQLLPASPLLLPSPPPPHPHSLHSSPVLFPTTSITPLACCSCAKFVSRYFERFRRIVFGSHNLFPARDSVQYYNNRVPGCTSTVPHSTVQ